MTREELERAVERAVAFMSPAEVRVVIRLVVEACCAKADECQGGFTSIAAVLRHTFLPTTEPTDG